MEDYTEGLLRCKKAPNGEIEYPKRYSNSNGARSLCGYGYVMRLVSGAGMSSAIQRLQEEQGLMQLRGKHFGYRAERLVTGDLLTE